MTNEYDEFKELIQELVQQEVQEYLKNEYIFRGITGQVVNIKEDGTCTVDIVTTILDNIENKSGTKLSIGDSVTLSERIGSNYTDCFINIKNGHYNKEKESDTLTENEKKKFENYINEYYSNYLKDNLCIFLRGVAKDTIREGDGYTYYGSQYSSGKVMVKGSEVIAFNESHKRIEKNDSVILMKILDINKYFIIAKEDYKQ